MSPSRRFCVTGLSFTHVISAFVGTRFRILHGPVRRRHPHMFRVLEVCLLHQSDLLATRFNSFLVRLGHLHNVPATVFLLEDEWNAVVRDANSSARAMPPLDKIDVSRYLLTSTFTRHSLVMTSSFSPPASSAASAKSTNRYLPSSRTPSCLCVNRQRQRV